MAQTPSEAAAWTDTDTGSFIIHLDNDEFAGINKRDRWYTSGIRLSWTSSASALPSYWAWRGRHLCVGMSGAPRSAGINHTSVGQNLYTQNERRRVVPLPNDRPVAAYLYASRGNSLQTANGGIGISMELGVTGPAALGKPVQNTLHTILGVSQVPGWQYQVRPRLGVNLHYQCLRRFAFKPVQLLTQYSVSAGSTFVRAGGAIALAIGPGRGHARIPTEAKYGIPDGQSNKTWSAVIGLRSNWTAYDVLLDGATFGYESSVRSKPLTGEFFIGASLNIWSDWLLEYIYTQRSLDFEGPGVAQANYKPQRIGTLRLRIPL